MTSAAPTKAFGSDLVIMVVRFAKALPDRIRRGKSYITKREIYLIRS